MKNNQSGMSNTTAIIGVVIICTIAIIMAIAMGRHAPQPAEKPQAAAETTATRVQTEKEKEKAEAEAEQTKTSRGEACKAAMKDLAASCDTYKTINHTYPLTMDDLAKTATSAAEIVADSALWVQYGAPDIDPFFDKRFVLKASCTDGMKYEYNSETGEITTTR